MKIQCTNTNCKYHAKEECKLFPGKSIYQCLKRKGDTHVATKKGK